MNNPEMYNYLENENLSKHIDVGDTIYLLPVNNNARYLDDKYNHVEEYKITKVGRKYLYIDDSRLDTNIKFEVYCGQLRDASEYCAKYLMFLSKHNLEFYKWLDKNNHRIKEDRDWLVGMIDRVAIRHW